MALNTFFHRTGILFCACSLILGLNLFIFSLPQIGSGIWRQSELANSALYFCGFLSALGMLQFYNTRYLFSRIFRHPLVFFPLTIGLLSLIFTPFYSLDIRNFLGSVRLGEGPLSWLSWSLLTASCLLLLQFKKWRLILFGCALLGFTTTYALIISDQFLHHRFAPFSFPDLLAFHILCLIPFFFIWLNHAQTKNTVFYGAIYITLVGLTYLTQNNLGLTYILLIVPFLFIAWKTPWLSDKRRQTVFGITTLFMMPVGAFFFLLLFLLVSESGYYDFENWGPISTIASRAFLAQTALANFEYNPFIALTGQGWGTFVENTARFIPSDWLDFTRERGPQWDGVSRDHFHSHNIFIETFYSAGLFAVIFLFGYLASIFLCAKEYLRLPALLFAGGLASVGSFWFLFPLHIPFIVLSSCILCGLQRNSLQKTSKLFTKTLTLLILGISMIMLLAGSYMTMQTALRTHQYLAPALTLSDKQPVCELEFNDYGAGGLHLAKLLISQSAFHVTYVAENAKKEEQNQDNVQKYIDEKLPHLNHLFCQSSLYRDTYKTSARLHIARLLVRSEVLISMSDWIDPKTQNFYAYGWKDELLEWINANPSRVDVSVPFLLYALIQNNDQDIAEVSQTILQINKDHPVGLWFKGLHLSQDPRRAKEGIFMMKKALQNDIERFMPIDQNIKQQILNAL